MEVDMKRKSRAITMGTTENVRAAQRSTNFGPAGKGLLPSDPLACGLCHAACDQFGGGPLCHLACNQTVCP
jgi:hypothetical protein